MCGIGAIYGKKIPKKEFWIKRSLDVIPHRGYALNESMVFDNCALGVNRLQIVDRDNAKQPLENEDKTIFVVLNGEVFNHEQLREELTKKGHKFKTKSDTEVLVHLWEEYKEEMVHKIDSEMFALFVYDKKKNIFFVARDPYGVKPLYYAVDCLGNYHFASEIKQLTQFKEIDEVKFFPQGHYMLDGKLIKYHEIPKENDKIEENEGIIIKKLRRLFDEAVKKRVNTDLPVGVFFSGGLDSAAILATAVKYHNNVTAFIVGYPNSPDVVVAKKYCEENNIPLVYFNPPAEEELAKIIPEIVYITESFEPNMIRQSAVSYYISKIARQYNFRIILCGEGPDEIFAGYPEFKNCLNDKGISNKIYTFIKNLPRTQFQRVDRTSMQFTLEVRVPFFDTAFADYAIRIPSKLKVKTINGKKVTKWILREAMKDRLPNYIANREKVVLSEGAGYKGNQLVGGLFFDIVQKRINENEFQKIKNDYPKWNITNKEVAYYFKLYAKHLFTKAEFNQERPLVNAIDSIKDEEIEEKAEKILIGMKKYSLFDRKETKKFNDFQELKGLVVNQIKNNLKIQVVGYWGIEKENADEKDITALDNLRTFKNIILKNYPNVEILLILTDIHGEANEVSEEIRKKYFGFIKEISEEYGFKVMFLSKLWKENKIDLKGILKLENLNNVPEIVVKSGFKHYLGKNKLDGARLYSLISKHDCQFIEKKFQNAIFFTYNSADWKELLPKLPTISLFPLEKGERIKPWHIK